MSVLVHDGELLELTQAQRPDQVSRPGWQNARAYTRDQNPRIKVWWVDAGEDAPRPEDQDNDGIPDYVVDVETRAHDVLEFMEDRGWRLPLADASFPGVDPATRGGDDLFDIYLVNFAGGNGRYIREQCLPSQGFGILQCAGVIHLENDFLPLHPGFASLDEAISVVVSHELFHAVQASYGGDSPGWWSEGSATWFEESYDPEQGDFESLASLYFNSPDRRLNDLQRGPTDGFSYGASLFVYSLVLVHGEEVVRRALEFTSQGELIDDALALALQEKNDSLQGAFERFALWNVFTGTLAIEGYGYPQAMVWSGVEGQALPSGAALNWAARVEPLAAVYASISLDRATTFSLVPDEERRAPSVAIVALDDPFSATSIHPDEPSAMVEQPGDYVLVVTSSSTSSASESFVAVRPAHEPELPMDMGSIQVDMGKDMDMGRRDGVDMAMPEVADMGSAPVPSLMDDAELILLPEDDREPPSEGGCSQMGTRSYSSVERAVPPLLYFMIWLALIAIRRRVLAPLDN